MTQRAPAPLLRACALAFASMGAVAVGGCETGPTQDAPAVLSGGDPAALERLKVALAQAMGAARVDLGPEDPTRSSVISVRPPPPHRLQDRNPALPTRFSIRLRDGACVLVREDTGAVTPLPGVDCRAAR